MGKIMEKEQELLVLRKQLEDFELERISGVESFSLVHEDMIPEVPTEHPLLLPVENLENLENVETVDVSSTPKTKLSFYPIAPITRKPFTIEKKLKLIDGDQSLADEISRGKFTSVKWGSLNYVPAWSNGRKYDPKNSRISKIRSELRNNMKSIRELAGSTGLSIDTVKDLVREMDKQGFFTNT